MSLGGARAHTLTVSGGRLLAENIADGRMGRPPAIELPFGLERIEMCTAGALCFAYRSFHDHRGTRGPPQRQPRARASKSGPFDPRLRYHFVARRIHADRGAVARVDTLHRDGPAARPAITRYATGPRATR